MTARDVNVNRQEIRMTTLYVLVRYMFTRVDHLARQWIDNVRVIHIWLVTGDTGSETHGHTPVCTVMVVVDVGLLRVSIIQKKRIHTQTQNAPTAAQFSCNRSKQKWRLLWLCYPIIRSQLWERKPYHTRELSESAIHSNCCDTRYPECSRQWHQHLTQYPPCSKPNCSTNCGINNWFQRPEHRLSESNVYPRVTVVNLYCKGDKLLWS